MRHLPGLSFAATALVAIALIAQPPAGYSQTGQQMTPLLLAVHDEPIPFVGSDDCIHLVYELWMTNFSSAEVSVEKVEVLGGGSVLQTLDAATVASRLQPAGQRQSTGTLAKGTVGLLFLNVSLPAGSIPQQLTHRVSARFDAAPPGHQEISETGGLTPIDRQMVLKIGPPLRGDNYISADSCCDATRHTRAALPVNGVLYVAQRYAVDWEQLDSGRHVYVGPREAPRSYIIYGKPVYAVADAVVARVITGQPEQTPGKFPVNISVDDADGNCIVLDLGQHIYALYAHMQSDSIHLHPGDHVKLGQIIGLVGNSGNSIAPHLHFQLTDGDLPAASNGLPYEITAFHVTGETPGTKAFDEAEANGTPLTVNPVSPPRLVKDALPLDQLIISFAAQ